MDVKRNTLRHIIIKMPKVKDKERILKAARERQLPTYKGAPINCRLISQQKLCRLERDWQEIFKVIKSKDLQLTLLYPAKLSFKVEGQIKCFPDKKKLKKFITTKPVLYKMLNSLL